jgi:hypothetical protein
MSQNDVAPAPQPDQQSDLATDKRSLDEERRRRMEALAKLAQSRLADTGTRRPTVQPRSRPGTLAHPARPAGRAGKWSPRLVVIPAVLVVCILILLAAAPGFPLHSLASGLVGRGSSAATATPVLPLSSRQLYLDVDVPGTVVTVDGHTMSLPVIGQAAPLVLSPGVHHVAWQVAPFPSQSCQLSIPASSSDTCQRLTRTASYSGTPAVPVVELGESLDSLPGAEQSALLQATKLALNHLPATTVQPGEYYSTYSGPSLSTTPSRAALHFILQSDAGTGCTLDVFGTIGYDACQLPSTGQDCSRFCSLAWPDRQAVSASIATSGWLVLAVVSMSWTYETVAGGTISSGQPLDIGGNAFSGNAANSNHLVMLQIIWGSSGWQITPVLGDAIGTPLPSGEGGAAIADNPACAEAQDLLYALRFEVPGGAPGGTVHLAGSQGPSDGCLITVGPAQFLVRLGIVIPVNPEARKLMTIQPRHMPVLHLTPNEQTIVQELRGQKGQDVGASLGTP